MNLSKYAQYILSELQNPNRPIQFIDGDPVNNLSDFKNKIEEYKEYKKYLLSTQILYRGHKSSVWNLYPKINRDNAAIDTRILEMQKLKKFKELLKEKDQKVYNTYKNDWEFLALAQHNGISTRFLDWTTDPYIALWFACIDDFSDKDDCNSSTVFIYFANQGDIVNEDNTSPFEVDSYKIYKPREDLINDRLVSQSGWFTVHSFNESAQRVVDFSYHKSIYDKIMRLIIPKEYRYSIIGELAEIGYTYSKIYPDLSGICQEVEWVSKNQYCILQ